MKLKLEIICIISVILLLVGCANKSRTYTYSKDKDEDLVITKAVYKGNELKLYCKGLDGKYDVTAFDSDFNMIDTEFDTEYKNGVFYIKGKDADKISGLYLDGNVRYHIRYLDSDEYAILYWYDATDIGWVVYGDEEKYYTKEELAKQKEAKEDKKTEQENNWKTVEGTWTCTTNSDLYIKFYETAEGSRMLERTYIDSNGEIVIDEMYVAVINITDSYARKQLEILDNPDWGMSMRFEISEDLTQIINGYGENEEVYEK